MSGIVGFTSSEISRLSGYHAEHLAIFLSEAQGIEPFAWDAAQSCATGEQNKIVALGNPLFAGDRFEAACNRWPSIRLSSIALVVWKEETGATLPGTPGRDWIDEIVEEWGETSDYYQSHVEGFFPREGADDALIDRSWFESADKRHKANGTPREYRYAFGVDPARLGADSSVVAAVQKSPGRVRVVGFTQWKKCDLMASVGHVRKALLTYHRGAPGGPNFGPGIVGTDDFDLVCDGPGIGAGLIDRLREVNFTPIEFNGGGKADDPDRYANLRAEVFWRLRKVLERGEIEMEKHPELWEELLGIRWGLNSAGKIQLEAKKMLKTRLGRSPDFSDALSLTFTSESRVTGLAGMVDF